MLGRSGLTYSYTQRPVIRSAAQEEVFMRSFNNLFAALTASVAIAALAVPGFAMGPSSPPAPTKSSAYVDGQRAVNAKDYTKAVPLLQKAISDNPQDADANNLLGYSYRKLGDQKAAFMYYQRALAIEPSNRGANEYLGELYVEMHDLPKAEAQLAKITQLCGTGCEEYRDLKTAIDKERAAGPAKQAPRTGA
jgi:tetratricopeptide (TPR) repeat protein